MFLWITLCILIAVVIIRNIVIVPEKYAYVIETFGAYSKTFNTGLNFKVPLIQRVARKVLLKEQVLDYPPQPVITKDNVTMQIDTVVYFAIKDPKLYAYGVDNPMVAMETLTATTLRNIIGEMELDDTLTSRDAINTKMCSLLDDATDPWGIKITRVELKNIMPPRDIQEAMEKQMRAEREKRESILRAEGDKAAAILQAQGEKESAILRAEAKKIEMLREAEGHAESIKMHKAAEAEGIIKLQQAEADAIKLLISAGMTSQDIVRLRGFDALKVAADGQATKVIIPSDIQSITSLAVGTKETVVDK
jgi:regulator of protease activity HflC (stomatin/prohibitin superfamily)